MRIGVFAIGAAIAAVGAFAMAGGCGLDRLDNPPSDLPTGGQDASTEKRDAGGTLTPEPTPDGGADADASAPDAAGDGGSCPDNCSSCVGGVCEIDCPGPKCPQNVSCAANMACRVVCDGQNACKETKISCPSFQPCTVRCDKQDACTKLTIDSALSASICLQCSNQNSCSGDFTCNNPLKSACTRACPGNGADKCPDLGPMCPTCNVVPDCP